VTPAPAQDFALLAGVVTISTVHRDGRDGEWIGQNLLTLLSVDASFRKDLPDGRPRDFPSQGFERIENIAAGVKKSSLNAF
jgi:hypothetical protein